MRRSHEGKEQGLRGLVAAEPSPQGSWCSRAASRARATRRREGPTPTATLGFTQLIPLEGTRNALLRITNTSDSAIDVTSVAIEWPGYPALHPVPGDRDDRGRPDPRHAAAAPRPGVRGAPGDDAVVGVVETEQGMIRCDLATDRDDVRAPPLAARSATSSR